MLKNKKIYAVLTLIAFMITLMPMAAFAAAPSADASYIETNKANVEIAAVKDTAKVTIGVLDAQENAVTTTGQSVWVWAEETSNQATDALKVEGATATNGIYELTVDGSKEINVSFLRAGKYTMKAAFDVPDNGTGKIDTDVKQLRSTSDKRVVTVTAKTTSTSNLIVRYHVNNDNVEEKTDGETFSAVLNVDSNNIEGEDQVFTILDKNGDPIGRGQEVKFSTNSGTLSVSKATATTDYASKVKVALTGKTEGDYILYVTVGDTEVKVKIKVGAYSATFIEATKTPAAPIATGTNNEDIKDFIQFTIKDINGNVMSGAGIKGATGTLANTDSKYVKIIEQPSASKLEDKNVKLVPVADKKYYTLEFAKELTAEGKYVVRVILDNGKSVDVSFEVKKFGTAKELKIEYPVNTVELGGKTDKPEVYFVDENGVKKNAGNRVSIGASGYAVNTLGTDKADFGVITAKNDEKYLGSQIKVTAVADREGLVGSAVLTVAETGREIKFDASTGEVNINNNVKFRIVDSKGNTVALGSNSTNLSSNVIITDVADKAARVSGNVSNLDGLKTHGIATLNLTADKATTANVQVYVKANKPNSTTSTGLATEYYAGGMTYTFGAKGAYADRVVVMTIGSADTIVNNQIVKIDTATLIKDNRTMVPYRALAENFGATVEFDAATQKVTAKLGANTVVMTIGQTAYTVNDVAKTLDVAPYINADNRTMIPVRFAAEALGFTVTPTYNADGSTASVVFTK